MGQVRRALELLDLPQEDQQRLLSEAEKPSNEQLISPDTVLETRKSWRAIERYLPEATKEVKQRDYVNSLVDKYAERVIDNVTNYRLVSKIANVSEPSARRQAVRAIYRLVKDPKYSIREAYADTVQKNIESRDVLVKAKALRLRLEKIRFISELSSDTLDEITQLHLVIGNLLATA